MKNVMSLYVLHKLHPKAGAAEEKAETVSLFSRADDNGLMESESKAELLMLYEK